MPTSGHFEDFFTGLTEDATPANDDLVMTYDSSGTALKKVQLTNLPVPTSGMVGYLGTLIHRVVVGAGGQASIDVSEIPADFDFIKIYLQGKTERAATQDDILIAFNNDTTDTNYYRTYTGGADTTNATNEGEDRTICWFGAQSNVFNVGQSEMTIVNPAGPFHKSLISLSTVRTATNTVFVRTYNLHWENSDAINRITLTSLNGSDFAEGTLCVIVGYKNH
jgi:hypothetical protein